MITSDLQDFSNAFIRPGRLLSIDYGHKKLGVAISNEELTMSLPIKQILSDSLNLRLETLEQIIIRNNITGLVLGLPLNMDGTISEQADSVKEFASKLADKFNLPIYLQDERLSSKAASKALKAAGFSRRERDSMDDQIAACIILDTVLNKLQRISSLDKKA